MADLDIINICGECLHPVEGSSSCPKCGVPVKSVPSLLLSTLRTLKVKGWIVEEWKEDSIMDSGFAKGKCMGRCISLKFYLFAPPTTHHTLPEIKDMKPWVVVQTEGGVGANIDVYRHLYDWAKEVPNFTVPFAQDFCDLCHQQGAGWYFSGVYCPVKIRSKKENPPMSMKSHYCWHRHKFAEGYPEGCVYVVEQVMTFPNRLQQLEKYFNISPYARRKCMKQNCEV